MRAHPSSRQVHSPRADRSDQPLLAPDQVLAVSAARPRHARRVSRARRRRRDRRRARRSRSTTRRPARPRRDPGLHHQRATARIASRTHYRARGALRRARRTARHVAARGGGGARRRDLSRPGRADVSAVSARLPRRPAARRLPLDVGPHAGSRCRRSGAISSIGAATSCPTPSSSRAAVRSTATSATRTRSSRAADRSTRSASTTRSPRSHGCPDAISTFSTTICSATRASRAALFDGMRGMNRLFQGAATVDSILRGDLIERAAEAGLRSLFVGFETLTPGNLARSNKRQNLGPRLHGGDRPAARARHHDQRQLRLRHGRRRRGCVPADGGLGDRARHHDGDVPHPDAVSGHEAVRAHGGRRAGSSTRDWDLYDTRHVVYRPARLTPRALEGGLRLGVPRVLSVVVDRAGVAVARHAQAPGEALLLCRGLEEVRAALGRW